MKTITKQILLRVCAILVALFSTIVFSSPTRAQVTAQELLTLPTDRIVELAIIGEPEAQFWVANAVYTGLLHSPKPHYEAYDWFLAAAEQGHVEATFQVSSIARYSEELRREAVALLLPLARNESGRAHYHLREQYNLLDQRVLALHHLRKAADLGYRPAMADYGLHLILSDGSDEPRNIARGAEMLNAVVRLSPTPDEMKNNDAAFARTCNAYNTLENIYSGVVPYYEDGQIYEDTTLQDTAKEIEVLESAADFGCVWAAFSYANRLLEGDGVEQNIEKAAFLLQYVLSAEGPDGVLFLGATFLAAKVQLALGDFDGAEKHIVNLPPRDVGQFYARENLVTVLADIGIVYGPAVPLCAKHQIDLLNCRDFLVELTQ